MIQRKTIIANAVTALRYTVSYKKLYRKVYFEVLNPSLIVESLKRGQKSQTTAKDWEMALINLVGNENISNIISNVMIPKLAAGTDTPCWTPSSNRDFSVKIAYNDILGSPRSPVKWKWIWRLRIPAKLESFLWICMHGKL